MLSIQRQAGQIGGDNRVLASVYNATSGTLARGAVVQYLTDASGSTFDGFSITTPTTNYLDLVAGIVSDSLNTIPGSTSGIPTGTAGFIITYGFSPYAALQIASGVQPAVGDKLLPVAGQTYLVYTAAGDGRDGLFCCLSSWATSTATQNKAIAVFVRAM